MRPHVILSCAMSLDGYIDDATDERLILSGPADLDRVDALRASCDAILVGAGTIRADNPRLLVRSEERRARRSNDPIKVTLTTTGDLDPGAAFFTAGDAARIVYVPPGVTADLPATIVAADGLPALLADLAIRGWNGFWSKGARRCTRHSCRPASPMSSSSPWRRSSSAAARVSSTRRRSRPVACA